MPHLPNSIYEFANFVNREEIDVAAFCEMENRTFRTNFLSHPDLFSSLTRLKNYRYFPTTSIKGWLSQGNMINSRFPILDSQIHKLPRGRRFLCRTDINFRGSNIIFFATHLSLNKYARAKQLNEVRRIIEDIEEPIILAGDFNAGKDELNVLDNLHKIPDHYSFPSWNPKKSIDHIFCSEQFRIVESYAVSMKISDHLPVVARLRFAK